MGQLTALGSSTEGLNDANRYVAVKLCEILPSAVEIGNFHVNRQKCKLILTVKKF